MAPHSSTLAWKIPWTEEPGRLQSMGLLRVGHNSATSLSLFTFMHWRRKWQPTPIFLPGESQGRRSLAGCRLWGRTESDTTEVTQQQQQDASLIFLALLFLSVYSIFCSSKRGRGIHEVFSKHLFSEWILAGKFYNFINFYRDRTTDQLPKSRTHAFSTSGLHCMVIFLLSSLAQTFTSHLETTRHLRIRRKRHR